MGTNGHHVLFYKNDWLARPDSKKLRNNHWLIPPIDVEVHKELHNAVSHVPTLGMYTLALVKRDFIPIKNDHVGSAHALIETINESRPDRVTPLEIEASHLVMKMVEAQIPFIEEGLMVEDEVYDVRPR